MAEHKDPHQEDSSIINGHDEKTSGIDSTTVLANPTMILIVTNVPDETFVNESFKVILGAFMLCCINNLIISKSVILRNTLLTVTVSIAKRRRLSNSCSVQKYSQLSVSQSSSHEFEVDVLVIFICLNLAQL